MSVWYDFNFSAEVANAQEADDLADELTNVVCGTSKFLLFVLRKHHRCRRVWTGTWKPSPDLEDEAEDEATGNPAPGVESVTR